MGLVKTERGWVGRGPPPPSGKSLSALASWERRDRRARGSESLHGRRIRRFFGTSGGEHHVAGSSARAHRRAGVARLYGTARRRVLSRDRAASGFSAVGGRRPAS